jgi:hypothetical protein
MVSYDWVDVLEDDRDLTPEETREVLLEAINSINALTVTVIHQDERIQALESRIEALEATTIVLAQEIS